MVRYYIGENAAVVGRGTFIINLDNYPPPDLVIEVASTSLMDDMGQKRLLYEDLNVKEYWIVDVENVRIIAFAICLPSASRTQTVVAKELPLLVYCQGCKCLC